MNIERAIEIKETTGDEFLKIDPDEIDEADRLSIEALKLVRLNRELWGQTEAFELPGETID